MNQNDIWEYTLQRDFGDANTNVYVHHVTAKSITVEMRMRVRIMPSSQSVIAMRNINLDNYRNRGIVIGKGMHELKQRLRMKIAVLRLGNIHRAQNVMTRTKPRKRVATLRGRK